MTHQISPFLHSPPLLPQQKKPKGPSQKPDCRPIMRGMTHWICENTHVYTHTHTHTHTHVAVAPTRDADGALQIWRNDSEREDRARPVGLPLAMVTHATGDCIPPPTVKPSPLTVTGRPGSSPTAKGGAPLRHQGDAYTSVTQVIRTPPSPR
ncbi:hypothetical protein ANANG_G00130810 [Anguilla anguilla]|uniref:Uncharacterized protein n=1 Tax=Anguilla anguilla TaxID=7936 RepID=A0A9D3S2I4_ANGAN|nr:hypothetical protein ANANG_G00130810 [Anguilla anguilla]